jgi:hypothetical protein
MTKLSGIVDIDTDALDAWMSKVQDSVDEAKELQSVINDIIMDNDEAQILDPQGDKELEEFKQRTAELKTEREQRLSDAVNQFNQTQAAAKQMSDVMTSAFAQIGSSFAQSLGEVAAGTQTLAEALSDISIQIIGALGDILILAGISTSPVGVPLVLAGLALKGFSSFASSAKSQGSGYAGISDRVGSASRAARGGNNFTIRGNDLTTAYDNSTTLNQRLY